MKINISNIKGFSLIEVVTTLTIMAVLTGIASMSFSNLSPKYKLLRAVGEINSRLNYARYKSIFKGVKVRIRFNRTSYLIEKYNITKSIWESEPEVFLEGVNIQANNSPTFHPVGTVSNLASICISNSWGKYKITMAISGRIKLTKILL